MYYRKILLLSYVYPVVFHELPTKIIKDVIRSRKMVTYLSNYLTMSFLRFILFKTRDRNSRRNVYRIYIQSSIVFINEGKTTSRMYYCVRYDTVNAVCIKVQKLGHISLLAL